MEWLKEKIRAELSDEERGLKKYMVPFSRANEINNLFNLNIEQKEVAGRKVYSFLIPLTIIKKIASAIDDYYREDQTKQEEKKRYLSSGLKKSLHGNVYQLKLLMLFVRRGLQNYSFTLATEMDQAEKFDDVVFKYKKTKQEPWTYRYLQAKHKLEDSLTITVNDLLIKEESGSKGDKKPFSLPKYFLSYCKIKQRFNDGILKDFIICTNINFDFSGGNASEINLKEALEEIKEEEEVLNIPSQKGAQRYRFKRNFTGKEKLVKVLLNTSDLVKLALELASHIVEGKKISLTNEIFKVYHVVLAKEVFNIQTINIKDPETKKTKKSTNGKFKESFIQGSKSLRPEVLKFRQQFIKAVNSFKPKSINNRGEQENKQLSEWEAISKKTIPFSGSFGKETNDPELKRALPGQDGSEDEVNAFLEQLVFAVNQPNEVELGEIIAKEIGDELNLVETDFVANYFQNRMLDWMKSWKNKKGDFFTTKDSQEFFETVKQKVESIILIGNDEEYRAELNSYGVAFKNLNKIQNFLESEYQIFNLVVRQDLYLYSSNVYQTLSRMPNYQKAGSFSSLRLKSAVNVAGHLLNAFDGPDRNLLMLECDANSNPDSKNLQTLFEKLNEILIKFRNKKIIFITKRGNGFPENLKKGVKYSEQLYEDSLFANLDEESRKEFESKIINFQGSQIPLRNLFPEGKLGQTLNSETLSELIANEIPRVGTQVCDLDSFEKNVIKIDR